MESITNVNIKMFPVNYVLSLGEFLVNYCCPFLSVSRARTPMKTRRDLDQTVIGIYVIKHPGAGCRTARRKELSGSVIVCLFFWRGYGKQ